ncbi:hypothetical protein D3C72_2385390 [compost metagenome]
MIAIRLTESFRVTASIAARLDAVSTYLKTDASVSSGINGAVCAVASGSIAWAKPERVDA